jgi:P4 family phage/plasmid primase-like protien
MTGKTRQRRAQSNAQSPFHLAAVDYLEAGYLPIPIPVGQKYPPPQGTPNEVVVDREQVDRWLAGEYVHSGESKVDSRPKNIGSIVPDGVVVLDIDGEPGIETLTELEAQYGELPDTWLAYRGDPERYHLWFTCPKELVWPGKLGAGLDIIYRHYRYVVLPPSIHPDGSNYRWSNTSGDRFDTFFPAIVDLPKLPRQWLDAANGAGYKHRERATVDSRLWLTEHGKGKMCPEISRVLSRHQRLLRKAADPGGLHDELNNGVWAITAEIQNGHRGGKDALDRFKETFFTQRNDSGRRTEDVTGEWRRACIGAIEKTAIESVRVGDPCRIEEAEKGEEPDRFFDPKHGLRAKFLADTVEKSGRLAVGSGDILYRHVRGLWTPDGEHEIYRRTMVLLGDRYRPAHASNVLSQVQHREPLITDEKQSTQYINVPNGLLDWRDGTLVPHSANIISTARIPVRWDPSAECPNINAWLQEVFPRDAVELAYEILGYMLYNDNPLHKAILLYGSGRNGKGTFIRLARMLVGHNNISAITPQALDTSQFSSAQLYGKLANLVGDVDPRIFKSTEQFKQLTGGDYMSAEFKHKDKFVFRCRALMIAAFNSLPRSQDTTEGFFSRWVVVPFTQFFPAGKADPNLIMALTSQAELQGLLRMAIGGLQNVMRRGRFIEPKSVVKATERFRLEADPMRAYLTERVRRVEEHAPPVKKTDVYADYCAWAATNGFSQLSAARFYEQMASAALDILTSPITMRTRNGYPCYLGIELR